MTDLLHQTVDLPCGVTIPNRIAKAGMSEQLAARDGSVTPELRRLYATWATGGAGLLVTGNVVTGRDALVEPRNVIVDSDRAVPGLREWSGAVRGAPSHLWMQIGHPGRVATVPFNRRPVGPSARREAVPGFNLRKPRALSVRDVERIVARFAQTAALAVESGFDGVQIHAAHGYLLSQFLSPLANTRTDRYGGDAAGRRRLLLDTVEAVRDAVGSDTPVGVKLNSADFQYGGFDEGESLDVVRALDGAGVDLVEISGGNYAVPAMEGVAHRDDANASRGYFAGFATRAREVTAVPLMLTGGLRTRAAMELAVARGIDIIGMARPMAFVPDYPARILAGEPEPMLPTGPPTLGYRPVDGYLQLAAHSHQLHRMARGLTPQRTAGLGTVARSLTRIGVAGAAQAVLPRDYG
ncbi:NADH:flavin oxidoreductase [Rhodococcus triatomae]|uniref:2,4-dienoyl-CoA reductase n=1 Tax=Rhodococcus triatomae TaxID=300028 RepID=A0A1G7ZPH6_9NOCA|nr:NADH:flavin oxidoreductase [Rhodococcus triatomae]QNG17989.1 NADH:flavin oxidoreductase [Rhodococcus triatomae]QNG22343.1 NADH:flavin oxidoreductase [Rhodococcus triatomae]SDH10525.1 2,4-dienoyl-CoA reductase [Rhodococcus triatomae]